MKTTLLVSAIVLAVCCSVHGAENFPSRAELEIALNNRGTVQRALYCIKGYPCKLPYGQLLRQAGPELIMTGRCPTYVCRNRNQQETAKWMIVKIQEKYPQLFYKTVLELTRRG